MPDELGPAVVLEGQRELLRALVHADRETRLGVRRDLRAVAEPVRRDAQSLAGSQISGMSRSPKWARMRTGVTRKAVYVAPRQKGVRGRGPRRRPNLFNLLLYRALEPALHRHESHLERDLEHTLDLIAVEFNRGGHL